MTSTKNAEALKHRQSNVYQSKDMSLALTILPTNRLAQNHLVLRLLGECVAKLKLSTVMPMIFENPLTVYTRLKGTEYEHCAIKLLEYLKERDKDTPIIVGGPQFYDAKLITLINLFHHHYELFDLLPNWYNDTTATDQSIIEAFDLLTGIVETRMYRSAVLEVKKEIEMHKNYRENMLLRKEIDYMRRKLRTQKQRQRWRRVLRAGGVFKYQDELTARKWTQFKHVSHIMQENSHAIKALHFGHSTKVNQLEDEVNALEAEYRKLRMTNAKQLKGLREEKNKFLIQLQNTIEKHDRLLGEKIKENVYLQDEFDKQREEMDLFMVGYSAIEKEYNEIVLAEQAEREKEWLQKANLFFQTRAVKILQRYWRKYLEENNLSKPAQKKPRKSKKRN